MNSKTMPAQKEDHLIDTILDGSNEDIGKILREEPACADFVRDIQSLKDGLQSIEEEPAPAISIEKIIRKNDRPLFARLQELPLEWYKNPYILSFGFLMAVICFYFLLVFVLDL
jgi:hypothetical protein